MFEELGPYIKELNDFFSKRVPKEHLEVFMVDVSNIVCSNWVIDSNNFKLTKQQINFFLYKLKKFT